MIGPQVVFVAVGHGTAYDLTWFQFLGTADEHTAVNFGGIGMRATNGIAILVDFIDQNINFAPDLECC